MEGNLTEISNKAVSWSMYGESNTDTIAQDAYDIGLWSESACWEDLDTEDGYIEIVDYFLPTVIPLCLTQSWANDFWVEVNVVGGYTFIEQGLIIEQEKTGYIYCIDIVIRDYWITPCGVETYLFGFELDPNVNYVFDANNIPDVIGDGFNVYPEEGDLDKWIDVYYVGLWTGCDLPDQQFLISIVHSNYGHYELCVAFSIIE
jgi:hypothetical protein